MRHLARTVAEAGPRAVEAVIFIGPEVNLPGFNGKARQDSKVRYKSNASLETI